MLSISEVSRRIYDTFFFQAPPRPVSIVNTDYQFLFWETYISREREAGAAIPVVGFSKECVSMKNSWAPHGLEWSWTRLWCFLHQRLVNWDGVKHSPAIVRKRATCHAIWTSSRLESASSVSTSCFQESQEFCSRWHLPLSFVKCQWDSCESVMTDLRHCLTACLSYSDLPESYAAEHRIFLFPSDSL